jgi:iron(III) transport system permease protein
VTAVLPQDDSVSSSTKADRALVWLIMLMAALPVLSIFVLAFGTSNGSFPANLFRLTIDTALLCIGAGVLSLLLGVAMAWLVVYYEFPGRRSLKWMALLPLALPGYIISFVYVEAFTYAGPVQTALRTAFGWQTPQDYWFPDIRSLAGASLVMALVLHPYVYLAARTAFMRQPPNQIHVARTLGRSPLRAFLEVALPQAKLPVFVGVLLVAIECINDIGAATFFGIGTLTTAVYGTWLDSGNLTGAAQIASLLILFVTILFFLQIVAQSLSVRDAKNRGSPKRTRLAGPEGFAATLMMLVPIFLGFGLPVLLLLQVGFRRRDELASIATAVSTGNSVVLALITCLTTIGIALLLGFMLRTQQQTMSKIPARIASLGYCLPGTVLGIGVLVPFGQADQLINQLTAAATGYVPGLLLSGGMLVLVYAYTTRFAIIAISHIQDGFDKIPTNMDDVARTLGRSRRMVFQSIHLPLLRPAMVAAALLVFVDAMKELPATLMLRPFDFETLATRVFTLASLGQYESASGPALLIVAAGLLPIIVLSRNLRQRS